MNPSNQLEYARELDRKDPLAAFRQRFVIDDPDLIYLDGNSLGRLPEATIGQMRGLVEDAWGKRLIRMWNDGWFMAAERIGAKIARIVGAGEDEVTLADSTSVNLFKLALAALHLRPARTKIVTDDLNFPSDLYILQGLQQIIGRPIEIEVVPSADGIHGPVAELGRAIDEDTALVTLSHTVFKSGYTYDMNSVSQMAHRAGAMVLWDLSHSAGALPVSLNESGADLAVGCSYKYLNGGPGAPAFLYVHRDLQDVLSNPVSGWMGQADMFEFGLDYRPAPGIRRFQTGTTPILSAAAVEMGVDMILSAGIDRLRAKSLQQSEYLISLWREHLAPLGFSLNTPEEPARRGSHVSLGHPDGLRIDLALIQEMNVLPDFRRPDNIRLGITPLYTTFEELHTAVMRLRAVVVEKRYEKYEVGNLVVT